MDDNKIDVAFIQSLEGFELVGYVPHVTGSNSGITIAGGVDLGQMDERMLTALEIPERMKNKLRPYLGKTRMKAKVFLDTFPLKLSERDAKALDTAVKDYLFKNIINVFNSRSGFKFHTLPEAMQTVYMSVAWQYGPVLWRRTPKFWLAVQRQEWETVEAELRDFGDDYPTRRNKEADYLRKNLIEISEAKFVETA